MADSLAVWLYGIKTAVIDQERGRLRFAYTEEALSRYPLGVPLLSLSLPLAPRRYTHGVVRPFLDGLLPEGEARQAIANGFGVLREDTFGLIRALGRDCAGALVILPADEPAPPLPTTLTAQRLSPDAPVVDSGGVVWLGGWIWVSAGCGFAGWGRADGADSSRRLLMGS